MNQNTPMIVLAICIAVLAFGLFQWMSRFLDKERKRLLQRLAGEGHLTAEEQPFVKAIVRDVDIPGLSGKLVAVPALYQLYRKINQIWPGLNLVQFLGMSLGLSLFGVLIAFAFSGSMLITFIAGGAGILPYFVLANRVNKRQRVLTEQLPEALDFLSRILRAGHSLSTGLQMIGEELPQPLAAEFSRCYDAHSLGLPLEEALKETATRVNSPDFGFFVTAVLIQRQTGGDLSEVLGNISNMIRGRLRLQSHVKAKTAEGRFTGYILTAFPAVMYVISYILSPTNASQLLHGKGLYMLGTAAGMCMLGLFCIKRITTLKV
ncbi:MAG TPA: type II secretion system F family protein [Tepidisphaeraceae bacterium]|nr:type II secretion system F family protein [Tepidisphaeraceae bacterium]